MGPTRRCRPRLRCREGRERSGPGAASRCPPRVVDDMSSSDRRHQSTIRWTVASGRIRCCRSHPPHPGAPTILLTGNVHPCAPADLRTATADMKARPIVRSTPIVVVHAARVKGESGALLSRALRRNSMRQEPRGTRRSTRGVILERVLTWRRHITATLLRQPLRSVVTATPSAILAGRTRRHEDEAPPHTQLRRRRLGEPSWPGSRGQDRQPWRRPRHRCTHVRDALGGRLAPADMWIAAAWSRKRRSLDASVTMVRDPREAHRSREQ